jgi:hypothetical protein
VVTGKTLWVQGLAIRIYTYYNLLDAVVFTILTLKLVAQGELLVM